MSRKKTREEFIAESTLVHKNKYCYNKVEYKDAKTKVCIICPEHGEFWQSPDKHLNGNGCPICANYLRKVNRFHISSDVFIAESKKVHGDEYDYSLVKDCHNNASKVKIICKKHGVFEQDYVHHVKRKQGCPKCAGNIKHTNETFEMAASFVHNNKYSYEKIDYVNNRNKVKIVCPIHGEFEQSPHEHLEGKGCPICANKVSKSENEIYNMLVKYFGVENIERRDRKILNGKEIDLFIKPKNIGIEYNGVRWHSENFKKDKFVHLKKTLECNKRGIGLIQIFEDEFTEKHDIVLSKLKQILGLNYYLPKIVARKCEVSEISSKESCFFLDKNHIQGHDKASIYLGCFFEKNLVGVMTFINEGNGNWNLSRFATDNSFVCIGIGGKLFKYFLRNYNPDKVKSFADRRWTLNSENNFYTKLGFVLEKSLKPDYRYAKGFKRIHKFNFRKKILHKRYGLPLSMTEKEMAERLGYYRIWDCGLFKYVWKNPKINEAKAEETII